MHRDSSNDVCDAVLPCDMQEHPKEDPRETSDMLSELSLMAESVAFRAYMSAHEWECPIEQGSRLATMRETARDAVPDLIEVLRDPDLRVREKAVECIAPMGPWMQDLEPALRCALTGEVKRSGRFAGVALAAMNPLAGDSTTTLIDALGDRDHDIRYFAERSLLAMVGAAVPGLVAALEHGDPDVRWGAVRVIGELGRRRPKRCPPSSASCGTGSTRNVCAQRPPGRWARSVREQRM